MAQYDGSIRINTKIDSKEASSQLMTLENRIVKTADKVASLRSKMDSLKDAKIPTEQYSALSKELEKLVRKQNSYNEQLKEFEGVRGKENLPLYKELSSKLEESYNSADKLIAKMRELSESGKAFTLGRDTEEFAKLGQQLKYAENDMAVLNRRHDELVAKQGKASDGYKKLGNTAKKSLASIKTILEKSNSYVDSFGRRIREIASKHLPIFRKEMERTKSSLFGFAGRLKGLALSLLIFNQISAAFRAASSAISTGFKNLYTDNEKFKHSIDGLKASVLTLENAFAAAFRPIADIAVPYMQELVVWLTEAVNLAGQFIAALTGRKTYTRAIKQSAAASEEAAEATEDETKAMNKQLSPLDKLNVLTSENAKEKDKDKNNGLVTGTMFEEVPIESSILDAVEKIKDIFSQLFAPIKEAWNREGQFVMNSWKYALEEVQKLIKDIGRDFLIVWNQEATIRMFQDILHIIGDIGLVAGNLARNFRDAWNESQTGLRILENIRDIFAAIIHNIRLAADYTAEWADKLNFSPLLQAFERFTASLVPVVDALSGVLTDFYTKVLLPLGKWALEKGLPELLDVFTAFNKKVDWAALRANIAEFWEHLEQFAETVGEGLIIFMERISDLVANFLNSDIFINFLHSLEDWMDNVTPEKVADAVTKLAEALIGLKAALLAFKVGGAISKGLTALIANLQTLAAMGVIAASVYVGIEFSKDYKEWKDNIEKYGWYEGRRKTAEENPANPYRNGTAITQEDGSGVFDQWMENLRAWQESNRKAREAEKEAQNQWLEEMKEKFRSIGEFIKNDWNNSYMGQMIRSFTDGSWKEALSLWGEDLKVGIKSVGEFIKDDWNNSYIGQMISSFTDGSWKNALKLWGQDIQNAFITLGERMSEKWDNTWSFMAEKASSVIQSIKSVISSAVSWIVNQIQSILNLFSQVNTAARSMTSGSLGSAMGGALRGRATIYSVSPSVNAAMAGLSEIEFPGYATGQVIPRTMRQHLAILGDNNRETEVVSPLSTIEQASEEAFLKVLNRLGLVSNSNSDKRDIVINIDGREVFRAVLKEASEYKKQTGRSALV